MTLQKITSYKPSGLSLSLSPPFSKVFHFLSIPPQSSFLDFDLVTIVISNGFSLHVKCHTFLFSTSLASTEVNTGLSPGSGPTLTLPNIALPSPPPRPISGTFSPSPKATTTLWPMLRPAMSVIRSWYRFPTTRQSLSCCPPWQ